MGGLTRSLGSASLQTAWLLQTGSGFSEMGCVQSRAVHGLAWFVEVGGWVGGEAGGKEKSREKGCREDGREGEKRVRPGGEGAGALERVSESGQGQRAWEGEGGRGGRRTKGYDLNIFNVFIVLKSFLLQRLHSIKI